MGESFVNFENLTTGVGNDSLTGTFGANVIDGGAGNDNIDGGGGSDTLMGGLGNDTLNGGFSTDAVFGGDGNDLITFKSGEFFDSVDGGLGNDTIYATSAIDAGVYDFLAGTITGFGGGTLVNVETLLASNTANDTIISDGSGSFFGQGGDDTMTGGIGAFETLDGGAGIDALITTPFSGNYSVNLTTGLTNFVGESFVNFENLVSGAGDDTLTGSSLGNRIDGGLGNDSIEGGSGADTLVGGLGKDTLVGGFDTDSVQGGDGNDLIVFSAGAFWDSVDGGNGVDTLDATAVTTAGVFDFLAGTISGFSGGTVANIEQFLGSNTVGDTIISNGSGARYFGQGGNDTMTAGLGIETLDGGLGVDTVITTPFAGNYAVNLVTGLTNFAGELFTGFENLTSGAGDDTLTGTAAANTIDGGAGDDQIKGGNGADSLLGNLGNDKLMGGGGADFLSGGIGRDQLRGDGGNDVMSGGLDNDKFVFDANFGNDRITDFTAGPGVGDVLNFSALGITLANLTISSAGGGLDTLVTVTGFGESVLLSGVAFGTLAANDFVF